jgi:hypothetical protein
MRISDYFNLTPLQFYSKTRKDLCSQVIGCASGGGAGLTQVYRTDSASITWTGDGTQANPLVATSTTGGTIAPNLLIAATDSSGNVIDGVANVISRTLTGFTVGANTAIVAGDTILGAFAKAQGEIAARALIASPTFTGTPLSTTATPGTNTTQIATTAFVTAAVTANNTAKVLTATATLTFPSTLTGTSNDQPITVTGAAVGDNVIVNGEALTNSVGTSYTAWISASNTVQVRFNNYSIVGAITPASGVFKVTVFKY